MLVKLSSKGQLVIPKALRQALNLEPGDLLDIRVTEEGTIILDPIQTSALTALWGKYADADLLGELEAEHREELSRDAGLRP